MAHGCDGIQVVFLGVAFLLSLPSQTVNYTAGTIIQQLIVAGGHVSIADFSHIKDSNWTLTIYVAGCRIDLELSQKWPQIYYDGEELNMKRTPQISSIFCFTKKDANDFAREAVTQQLKVTPTETCGPMVSPGRFLNCNESMYELPGLTLVGNDGKFVKHAFWSVDIPKISCWSIDEPLQKLESIFNGKESFVRTTCLQNDLCANLIIRIFADSNNMPEVTLSSKSLLFWASMEVDIDFDFYLD